MKQILVIDVSPRGAESANRRVAKALTDRLPAQYPSARIIHRDLAKDNLPHLDGATLKAISTKDAAEALKLKESARLSDQLTEELLPSDLPIVTNAPTAGAPRAMVPAGILLGSTGSAADIIEITPTRIMAAPSGSTPLLADCGELPSNLVDVILGVPFSSASVGSGPQRS